MNHIERGLDNVQLYNDPSKINWKMPIVIDFETYYDKEYSLSKITTEKYIRCDRFECIGVAIKIGSMPTYFHKLENGIDVIRHIITSSYPNSPVVCLNAPFDMGILAFRYGIHPSFTVDVMVMAKLCGFDRVAGGTSLAKLSAKAVELGIISQVKGNEVHNMLGVHASDMTAEQWQSYGDYCKLDVDLTYALYMYMVDKVPTSELIMADITTKMWTKPAIQLDVPLLENYAEKLATEREQMLLNVAGDLGFTDTDELLKNLRSSKKFVALLEHLGIEVPLKWSEKKQEMIPAVSKTDLEFLELLEHENPLVRALVETKLGTMSSLAQTRTANFLDIASRGLFPVALRYASAHTGRYGGGDGNGAKGSTNVQNLPKRTGDTTLRKSMRAMDSHVLLASDSSQIECRINSLISNQQDLTQLFLDGRDPYVDMATAIFNKSYDEIIYEAKVVGSQEGKKMRNLGKEAVLACISHDTEVLCQRGWVAIQDIQDDDLLWDGENWVSHGGIVPMGEKDCINFGGVDMTPDHKVYNGIKWEEAQYADSAEVTGWAIRHLPDTE